MYFEKRYQGTERNEKGKLISTFSYSTPEKFDRYISQYPPMKLGRSFYILGLFPLSWNPAALAVSKVMPPSLWSLFAMLR